MTVVAYFISMCLPTQQRNGLEQLREAFPFDQGPGYLLRDHDAIFGNDFREQVRDLGIREVLSTPRSPWQRAYIERVIGSIRLECLDHVIVFEEASLRRTLAGYFQYYHGTRMHISLGKDPPQPRRFNRREWGEWWRRRKWADYITATNDEPPEQPETREPCRRFGLEIYANRPQPLSYWL